MGELWCASMWGRPRRLCVIPGKGPRPRAGRPASPAAKPCPRTIPLTPWSCAASTSRLQVNGRRLHFMEVSLVLGFNLTLFPFFQPTVFQCTAVTAVCQVSRPWSAATVHILSCFPSFFFLPLHLSHFFHLFSNISTMKKAAKFP